MIVRELIEQLQELHPEQVVVLQVDLSAEQGHADPELTEKTLSGSTGGTVALIKPGRTW